MELFDHYRLLGVTPQASPEEIKRAYRKAAKSCHPDLCEESAESVERFKQISEAYRCLIKQDNREHYDERQFREQRYSELAPELVRMNKQTRVFAHRGIERSRAAERSRAEQRKAALERKSHHRPRLFLLRRAGNLTKLQTSVVAFFAGLTLLSCFANIISKHFDEPKEIKLSPEKQKLQLKYAEQRAKMQAYMDAMRAEAISGDASAQYLYASSLHEGRGVAKNKAEAIQWWQLAAAQNHQGSRSTLERLGVTVPPLDASSAVAPR